MLLSLVLSPIVRVLARWRIPYPARVALVLALVIGAVGGGGYMIAGPVPGLDHGGTGGAPEGSPEAQGCRPAGRAGQPRGVAGRAGHGPVRRESVVVQGPSLSSRLADRARRYLGGTIEVLLLLNALLAVGDLVLQKLVEMLPRRGRPGEGRVDRASDGIVDLRVPRSHGATNISEGAVVAAAMAMVGMPTPLVWGTMVALAELSRTSVR